MHQIYAGQEKESDADLIVTTWQSVMNIPEAWFRQFKAVIGDEAHLFGAKKLSEIMDKLTMTEYRIATTGTVDEKTVILPVLEGHFGPFLRVVETHELISDGTLAKLKIYAILLNYSDEEKAIVSKMEYVDERHYILNHQRRNDFIKQLVLSLKGNTLVMFRFTEHGRTLLDLLKDHRP